MLRAASTAPAALVPEGGRLRLKGYAVPFGQLTLVDNPREGRFLERIDAGAFTRSLATRGLPALLVDHGLSVFGRLPAGVITAARADNYGLYVEADMHTSGHWPMLLEAITTRAVPGMSIGAQLRKDHLDYNNGDLIVTVLEADLIEVSLTATPTYTGTSALLTE